MKGKEIMTTPFTPQVTQIIAFSREEAQRLESPVITPAHLLLGMLRNRTSLLNEVFRVFEVNPALMKLALEASVRKLGIVGNSQEDEMQLAPETSLVLKQAVLEARRLGENRANDIHLLLAVLHSENREECQVLKDYKLTYAEVMDFLMRQGKEEIRDGLSLSSEDDVDDFEEYTGNGNRNRSTASYATHKQGDKPKTPILDKFSTDLTQAARDGELDPVVGREKEINRVSEILCRRKKNNPILLGEPGVGKSAIVEGLAQRIVNRHTSPILFDKRLVSLDMTAIVAGTKYRGQFEERLKALMNELEENPDIIVFIDEIHTIIGAGSNPGSMDAANILKPALSRGKIQCIGATTYKEYNNTIEKDGALERRFQKVSINETTPEETLEILFNIRDRYERHHSVSYTDEALEMCVKLANRYINGRYFPDKAIDVMDEVGAHVHLTHAEVPQEITEKESLLEELKHKKTLAVQEQKYELAAGFRDEQVNVEHQLVELQEAWKQGDIQVRTTVEASEVAAVVSSMTGVPVQRMVEAETARLKNLGAKLRESVIAQDNAIDKLVKAIQRNRVGLRDPNHPIGVFMFLGPTGVGKTYLSKKLAEEMFGSADALIRIDMSEYAESFNTSRLVGAPPGYVGYDEGGQLTEKVRRNPYSIVLLDEIEKAHGNVFNMLLQVLDEGRLTDGNGRLVDFRNTIIIMTSNAGTRQLKDFGRGVGFQAGGLTGISANEKDKEYARSIVQKSLQKQFAPEFLNRLDEIITFDQLDLQAIKQIVDIELKGLVSRIEGLGYHLQVTEEAKEFVANKGYDVQYGARPLKRAIQNHIEDGVCEMLLDGTLLPNDTIIVEKADDTQLRLRKA